MELIAQFIDIVLHVDKYLAVLLAEYGTWIYAILFAIVFCETGLVITPFLPGDSLLFVAGALAATSGGSFDISLLIAVLLTAAILGDNTNYWIGRWAGKRILAWGDTSRFFNRKAFDVTHAFYEKHGGKTMLVARFMPFVRTFAPFVAGVAEMTYVRYFLFDLAGAVLWVFSLCLAGYWFGNLPWVRTNLSFIVFGTIALSLLPLALAWLRHRLAAKAG
ncbi:MAG: DedA family protein [Sulfuritalea sp.]|nr:DedA family protein [Sulfuritalea sp.]MCF8197751.1 DedA family protein [Sulfuritalea sp.]